jgi:hypothetical protein
MAKKDTNKVFRIELLDKDAQKEFRADYRQTESEVQKNIAVYLSALVVATGWVFGPQSKPIEQLFLGNEAVNLFGFIILIAINAIFASFLTYKSIQIHEIMQFVTMLSPDDSPLQYWEAWRRSGKWSLSKGLTRILYFVAISLVPLWVSGILLWGTLHYIRQDPRDIAVKIQQMEEPRASADAKQADSSQHSSGGKSDSKISAPSQQDSEKEARLDALTKRVAPRLRLAKCCLIVVSVFHSIPIWFFLVTWLGADSKWKKVRQFKNMPDFDSDIFKEDGPPNFISG